MFLKHIIGADKAVTIVARPGETLAVGSTHYSCEKSGNGKAGLNSGVILNTRHGDSLLETLRPFCIG